MLGLMVVFVAAMAAGAGTFVTALKTVIDDNCGAQCQERCADLPLKPKPWYCDDGCDLCRCFTCDTPADCKPGPGQTYACVRNPVRGINTCVRSSGPLLSGELF